MFKEFKEFAIKGNVIDLAVAVIIGGAFGKIIASLVNDIIMPLVGIITGGKDFSNLFILLKEASDGEAVKTIERAKELNLPTLSYGLFITQVVDFLIVAVVIFMFVKILSKLKDVTENRFKGKNKQPEPVVIPTTKECMFCKSTIHIDAKRCPNCTSEL